MKKAILSVSIAIILVVPLLASCGGIVTTTPPPVTLTITTTIPTTLTATTTPPPVTLTITTTIPTTLTATTTPPPVTLTITTTTTSTITSAGENLETILERMQKSMANVRFDVVATEYGVESTMQCWMMQDKLKIRMTADGETIVIVVDQDNATAVMYFEGLSFGFKIPFDEQEVPLMIADVIVNSNPLIIGYETIDGMSCAVLEYTVTVYGAETVTKSWIWVEYGFPVKEETETDDGQLSTVIYKNISFGTVTDSDFDIPANVVIVDSSA
ncbi:MAG: hypothetical protein FWH51_00085 [Dehalococcoidia bacterium]|nr:hypothetical protein [Dehalococcoidia bacterium]